MPSRWGRARARPQASTDGDAQRIQELEQQVQDLESQLGQSQQTTQGETDQAQPQGQAQPQQTPAQPTPDANVTSNYPEIADFESRVAALEQDFSSASAGSDMNANYQTYLQKKSQADALEAEMDRFDEQQEYAAQSGQIPYADYLQIEAAIDQLDRRLETAEDSMKYTLGIWDD